MKEINIFFKDLSEDGQNNACKYLQEIGQRLTPEMLKNIVPVFTFKI